MQEEIWKDIPNFKGYQVSNLGRVRTFNKITHTNTHGERHWKNRILKPRIDKKNNCQSVQLWKDGKHKSYLIYRLEAFTFYNQDFENSKKTVNHIDGNRNNNKLSNLEIISLKENIQHAFNNGLMNNVCKKIKLTNKTNCETISFKSMADASKYMNYSIGYISSKVKKNKYENYKYKWEIL